MSTVSDAQNSAQAISAREWAWVESLIRDVQEQERRDSFLATFYRWDMAIRELQKREWDSLDEETRTEADLRHHRECLQRLMKIGEHLCQEARRHENALKEQEATVEVVEATQALLGHIWTSWHEPRDPEVIAAIKRRIFDGEA